MHRKQFPNSKTIFNIQSSKQLKKKLKNHNHRSLCHKQQIKPPLNPFSLSAKIHQSPPRCSLSSRISTLRRHTNRTRRRNQINRLPHRSSHGPNRLEDSRRRLNEINLTPGRRNRQRITHIIPLLQKRHRSRMKSLRLHLPLRN